MKEPNKKEKKRWSTKAVMQQIYDLKMWGGKEHDFYSGDGSHSSEIVDPYVLSLRNFLQSFSTPLVVLDLGCGDFNIGSQLILDCKKYHAVDIVPDLIERNKQKFLQANLEFYCLDICKEEWPKADCVILRQVVQHLSNTEIIKVLNKLRRYKYLVLTEHVPNAEFIPNTDIITGQGIRLKKNSGVDILEAPFNMKASLVKVLTTIDLGDNSSIATTLYEIN